MSNYKILGRSGAGSLIPEFLLTELGIDYDIEFPKSADLQNEKYIGFNPLGKTPVLICPNGLKIFETVAIVTHITTKFDKLIPATQDQNYSIYWQILSLLATSVYPAYHRQHHSQKYVEEFGIASLKIKAQAEQAIVFDYLEGMFSPFLLLYKAKAPIFFAAAGLFVAYSGGIYAIQNTTVANAMLLFASAPFITSILAYALLREKIKYYTVIAILLALIGISIMVLESVGSNSLKGGIAGVVSAFGFSIFTVSLRWGKNTDMLPAVFLSGLIAISLTIPICYYQGLALLLDGFDAAVALGLGVFQVGFGLILYTAGSKTVPAAELTLLSLSEVLLGPIWVWLILGEKATNFTLIGGTILLIAIIYNSIMLIKSRRS